MGEGAACGAGHQERAAAGRTPRDEVGSTVAGQVAAGRDLVEGSPRALDGHRGREAAPGVAGPQPQRAALAGQQVGVAVAGQVADRDEEVVAGPAEAERHGLEATRRVAEEGDQAARAGPAGDQVDRPVAVEVADRGQQLLGRRRAARSRDRRGELAAARGRRHRGPAVGAAGHHVGSAVTGQVGREGGLGPAGPGPLDLVGRAQRGESAGGQHDRAAVAAALEDEVGVGVVDQVGLQRADLDGGRGDRGAPLLLDLVGQAPDPRELRIEVAPGTGRGPGVAMAADRCERAGADPLAHRGRVHPAERELPGEEAAVGPDHLVRGLGRLVVAQRRHRERVVVVAEGVGADDGPIDPAVPTLPDPAEPVDQVVVADVAPAQ